MAAVTPCGLVSVKQEPLSDPDLKLMMAHFGEVSSGRPSAHIRSPPPPPLDTSPRLACTTQNGALLSYRPLARSGEDVEGSIDGASTEYLRDVSVFDQSEDIGSLDSFSLGGLYSEPRSPAAEAARAYSVIELSAGSFQGIQHEAVSRDVIKRFTAMAKSTKSLPTESCQVCCEPSSGVHFGVFSCEGCKRFFQRVSGGGIKKLKCRTGHNNCIVSGITYRTKCKFCRFKKCVRVGMSANCIKLGRDARKLARELPRPCPTEDLPPLVLPTFPAAAADGYTPSHSSPTSHSASPVGSTSSCSPTGGSGCSGAAEGRTERMENVMNSVLKLYLQRLHQDLRERILSKLLDKSCQPADFFAECSNAVITYIGRLPGIVISSMSQTAQGRAELHAICMQLLATACVHTFAKTPDSELQLPRVARIFAEFRQIEHLARVSLAQTRQLGVATTDSQDSVTFCLETLHALLAVSGPDVQANISKLVFRTNQCLLHSAQET